MERITIKNYNATVTQIPYFNQNVTGLQLNSKCSFVAILFICLISTLSLYSQSPDSVKNISPVLVTNHSECNRSVIMVKWITDELIYPLGVNIYRQEFGDIAWQKLTPKPLVKGMNIPSVSEYKADSTLKQYVDMARTLKVADLKDFVKVYVLVKSVQSGSFARYIGIQYTDSMVIFGKTYRYKVIAQTTKGEKVIGHSKFIQVDNFILDKPPSGIEVKAKDKKVLINWTPEDLRFYGVNIYRSSGKDTVKRRVNSVPLMISKRELPDGEDKYPDVFFTDSKLENRVKYTYQVAGIDFFGRETQHSSGVTVMPCDQTPPLAPYSIRGKVNKYSIKLRWLNKFTPDQEGISIYRSYKRDNQYVKINSKMLPLTDTTYIDRDIKPGFYYYVVASVDSAGNEGRSAKVLAEVHDITPPAAPQNLLAAADTGRILLLWDMNAENDLLGYQIYRTVDNDRQDYFALLNAIPFYANAFIDTLPVNARNFFIYKVAAVDSALNRSGYSVAVKAKMPDITPPVQPVIIGVSSKDNYLTIEWIPNFESDLAGYELFRYVDSAKHQIKLNEGLLAPSVKRYTDRTFFPDTLYHYTLQALDSTGNRSRLSEPFVGVITNNISNKLVSELIQFTVKKPLFSKTLKIQWKISKAESFIGCTIYRRSSPEGESKRLNNLTLENSYIDADKIKPTFQYQLRIYHKTGQVVKSEWVSRQ